MRSIGEPRRRRRGSPDRLARRGGATHAFALQAVRSPMALNLPDRLFVTPGTPPSNSFGSSMLGRVPLGLLWRTPLLLWLGYTGFRHLADADYFSLFSGITFGAHEFGHLAFAFFGEVLAVAGGSLMQLLVPIGAGALLASRRDWFGVVFTACWLSVSMTDLARYVGDAQAQELPLVSMSPDGGEHDWYWLLDRFDLLRCDTRIAAGITQAAALVLLSALAAGAWICLRFLARPQPVAAHSQSA